MPSLTVLLVVFALFVLAVVPTRRLSRAGWPPIVLLVYLVALIGLAFATIEMRGALRLMVPLVVLLFLLPFAASPELLARLVRRRAGGPPGPTSQPRDVTPPDLGARIVEPPRLQDGRPPVGPPATPGEDAAIDQEIEPKDRSGG